MMMQGRGRNLFYIPLHPSTSIHTWPSSPRAPLLACNLEGGPSRRLTTQALACEHAGASSLEASYARSLPYRDSLANSRCMRENSSTKSCGSSSLTRSIRSTNWARNEMDPPYPPMANPSNDSVAPLLRSSALTSVLDSVPLLKSGEYN
jgi:hypothetical protein